MKSEELQTETKEKEEILLHSASHITAPSSRKAAHVKKSSCQVCQAYQAGASPGTTIPHNRDYLAISKPARATIANLFDRVYLTVFMRSIRSINQTPIQSINKTSI